MFQIMKHYIRRLLAQPMREGLQVAPVVVLTGARQTGKTTLLSNEPPFSDWVYYSLDDPDVQSLIKTHPRQFLGDQRKVVIDEVQKAPELFSYIKMAVDEDRSRSFVLSGSANLLLMKGVSESLAGRAIYFELFPFTLHEYFERPNPPWLYSLVNGGRGLPTEVPEGVEELDFVLFRGLMPAVVHLRSASQISMWWRGYIATYLERDLRTLSQVGDLVSFHRFMEVLALRSGRILKQNEAARDAGLSFATASRYIGLLETSGLFFRLRPFFENLSKRLIKSPKAYFVDTGLTCALAGFKDAKSIPADFKAQLFEGLVFQNLYCLASCYGANAYYFRTLGGREIEVDFVIEVGGELFAFEAKYSDEVGVNDVRPLLQFSDLVSKKREVSFLGIIYTGREIKTLPGGVVAIPWQCL